MKAYLGPYPSSNWWTTLLHFLHIPYKRKEKVRVDYYDHWNADRTIALVALPVLKQLKERGHTYNDQVDVEDVPETITDPLERWTWVLDEIIWTFEQLVDDDSEEQFYSGDPGTFYSVPSENHPDMYELKIEEHPTNPLKIDYEGLKAWNERQRKGVLMFGKYFFSLWD